MTATTIFDFEKLLPFLYYLDQSSHYSDIEPDFGKQDARSAKI